MQLHVGWVTFIGLILGTATVVVPLLWAVVRVRIMLAVTSGSYNSKRAGVESLFALEALQNSFRLYPLETLFDIFRGPILWGAVLGLLVENIMRLF